MKVLRLGIVGCGKIARDQHLPAIAALEGVEVVAVADPFVRHDSLPSYTDLAAMLDAHPDIAAISLCQPPQARYDAARLALLQGKHLFLEKPPGATISEAEALVELAARNGLTLYTAWHSRHASGVAAARDWVAARSIEAVRIAWKEDVRHWHPGQRWIWQAGGFGVFDPGINALSILTAIIPDAIRLIDATMEVPSNCQTPIAARLALATAGGIPISAEFDFRQTGPQTWDIAVEAADGTLCLGHGGNTLSIDGMAVMTDAEEEYRSMYREFRDLVRDGRSMVDLSPLKLIADAFLRGQTSLTAPFHQ